MIKNATFISVWDDGYEIISNCKVDIKSKKFLILSQLMLMNWIWKFLKENI